VNEEHPSLTRILELKGQGQDAEAKALLVSAFYRIVLGYAYRWCKDGELAEDLTQETFVRFLTRYWERLSPNDHPKRLLLRICHRLYFDYLDRHKKEVLLGEQQEDVPEGQGVELTDTADELAAACQEHLSTLDPEDQWLLELRLRHGKTLDELCEALPGSRAGIAKRLGKLMRALRAYLQRMGWDCPSGPSLR
jgi:RNA polymerase sigma factor (sigma-70 family)